MGLEVHDGGTTLGPNKAKVSCQGVLRKNEIYALEPTVLQPDGLPCAIIEDDVIPVSYTHLAADGPCGDYRYSGL